MLFFHVWPSHFWLVLLPLNTQPNWALTPPPPLPPPLQKKNTKSPPAPPSEQNKTRSPFHKTWSCPSRGPSRFDPQGAVSTQREPAAAVRLAGRQLPGLAPHPRRRRLAQKRRGLGRRGLVLFCLFVVVVFGREKTTTRQNPGIHRVCWCPFL